jgi:outer membrane receptor for ferric coprogen and ferric-rhodotorulic acid
LPVDTDYRPQHIPLRRRHHIQSALDMNLNNVFDKRYWIPGCAEQNGNNDFGDPRNVMFTLKYTPRI